MMNRYKSLANDSIILTVGNFSSKLIIFLLMPVYTVYLSKEQYGISDLINNSVELLIPIGTICIADALFRFSFDYEEKQKEMLQISFIVILGGLIIILCIIPILSKFIQREYIFYFLLIYLTSAYKNLFSQFARGKNRTKLFAISNLLGTIALCIFNIYFLAVIGLNIRGYLLSIVLSNLVVILIILSFIRRDISSVLKIKGFNLELFRDMLYYSIFLIPNAVAWWISNISDRYFIIVYYGAGVAGIYAAAAKVPALMNVMASIFQQAWQISSIKEYNCSEKNEYYSVIFNLYSFALVLGCSMIILVTPLVSKFLLAKDFYSGWVYTPILVLATLYNCFSYYFGTFYTVIKRNKMLMITTLVGALLNIILNIILIKPFGVYGACIATLISYLVIFMIRYQDTKKFVKIKIDIRRLILKNVFLFMQVVSLIKYKVSNESILINILCVVFIALLDCKKIVIIANRILKLRRA